MTQQTALASASTDDVLHIKVGSGTTADVNITAGDTLATIASKINADSDSQVYASVINNKLVLSGQVTGAANTIAVTSDHTLAADLGVTQTLTANDAAYTINGQPMTSASNIVSNGLAGMTLTCTGRPRTMPPLWSARPRPARARSRTRSRVR